MYDSYQKVQKFVNKLDGSFVLTGSEVVHIRNVHYLSNTQFLHHHSYHATEIHIVVDATCYSIKNDKLIEEEVHNLYLTLDTSQVVRITEENVAILLIDNCRLVREAAQAIYSQAV